MAKDVSEIVAGELKDIWELHFGINVVSGNKFFDDEEDDTAKMVIRQDNVAAKISNLFSD